MKGSVVQEARSPCARSALGHRAVGPGLGVERSGVDAHPRAPVTAFRDQQLGSSPLLPACEPLGLVDRRTAQSGPFINALTARARLRKETIRSRKQTLFPGWRSSSSHPITGKDPSSVLHTGRGAEWGGAFLWTGCPPAAVTSPGAVGGRWAEFRCA